MLAKEALKKEFQKKPKEYWEVELFRQKGFVRRQCPSCGKFFRTLDADRQRCADSSCVPYEFIGDTITKGKWDYIETWKLFEKFFVREGHASIKRYPVIDRVRPDLFFTIASIQDFQRIENGSMTFVYPANPLIVPQVCLRFGDIASVGVSGRHLTSFVMPGQHAFGWPKAGYFKDRCMELNFAFLTKEMGIPAHELVYAEDLWAMPDFSAFGPSIETFSRGLELVNHVFMQFQKSGQGFRELPIAVNDTGWGHERLVWFSHGTETMYDCIFGPVLDKVKKASGVSPDPVIFSQYAKMAGALDIDELRDAKKAAAIREQIAKTIGVSVQELKEQIEPMQALYAIADHSRTLLFAITDGGIPSNVGGGYNLRVILRRALSFIDEYHFDIDLAEIAGQHARYLRPLFPELMDGRGTMAQIIPLEAERYNATRKNAKKMVLRMKSAGQQFDENTLITLYESHGIAPEIVKEIAGMDIPPGIYKRITEKHEAAGPGEEKEQVDVTGLEPTQLAFYQDHSKKAFTAKVLAVGDKYVVLDKTYFYAESGGQEADHGTLNDIRVYDVQKVGTVVLHYVEETTPFTKGKKAKGVIDGERRDQLMKHHTAIHVVNGVTRKVLGSHVFQAGAHKAQDKAHLDITHFRSLTTGELDKIEAEANRLAQQGIGIRKTWLDRNEAEKRYGTQIYQGGMAPGKQVRIVDIEGEDIEACGGTHLDNTKDIGRIVIIGSERIQDGIDRITIKAGPAAEAYLKDTFEAAIRVLGLLETVEGMELDINLNVDTAYKDLRVGADVFSVSPDQLERTVKRFIQEIRETKTRIREAEATAKIRLDIEKGRHAGSLREACQYLFDLWKTQKKALDGLQKETAQFLAEQLLAKRKGNQIIDIVSAGRKELIETANELVSRHPELSIILANQAGDLVCRSETKDMAKTIQRITALAGGSGGGSPKLAQGKVQVSKLMKIMESFVVE